jgi:hypothetical protein
MENNPTLRWSQSPETSRIGLGIADRGSYMGLFLGYKPHNENCCPLAAIVPMQNAVASIIPILGQGLLTLLSPGKHRPFIELAYGYLPLVLGGTLAHYLRLELNEAGQV